MQAQWQTFFTERRVRVRKPKRKSFCEILLLLCSDKRSCIHSHWFNFTDLLEAAVSEPLQNQHDCPYLSMSWVVSIVCHYNSQPPFKFFWVFHLFFPSLTSWHHIHIAGILYSFLYSPSSPPKLLSEQWCKHTVWKKIEPKPNFIKHKGPRLIGSAEIYIPCGF